MRLWQYNAKLLYSRLNLDFDDIMRFSCYCNVVMFRDWVGRVVWDSLGQFGVVCIEEEYI